MTVSMVVFLLVGIATIGSTGLGAISWPVMSRHERQSFVVVTCLLYVVFIATAALTTTGL